MARLECTSNNRHVLCSVVHILINPVVSAAQIHGPGRVILREIPVVEVVVPVIVLIQSHLVSLGDVQE